MNLQKMVFLIYFAFSLYTFLLLQITDINTILFMSSTLLMWLIYIMFFFGQKTNITININDDNDNQSIRLTPMLIFFLSMVSLVSSALSVQYYTGNNPIEVFNKLQTGMSVYNEYQQYFKKENLSSVSISKLPYILMLFCTKIIFLYFTIYVLLIKKNKTKPDYFFLIVISISHIYIGLGRGTSFEIFELLILYIYIILYKFEKNILNLKRIIIMHIIIMLGISLFLKRIEDRVFKFDLISSSKEVNFYFDGPFATLFPDISSVLFKLYGYFGFGFYYMYIFVDEIWFNNFITIIYGLFPKGLSFYYGNSLKETMSQYVDIGVKWHPDLIVILDNFGFVGTLLLIYLCSVTIKALIKSQKNTALIQLTCFLILFQMISLPIGNFVVNSSSNKLTILLVICIWAIKMFKNKTIIKIYN